MSRERRRFLKTMGLAGASVLGAAPLLAAAAPKGRVPPIPPIPPPPPPPATPGAPEVPSDVRDDAQALAGIVERRYGKHLDAKQLEAVTRELENRIQGGKALRAVKLANADEPDTTFRA